MENKYDYLIVGAGVYGVTCARELTDLGFKCLVIDKRHHIAGNCYTEKVNNVDVHKYGAHIFHTGNEAVWNYVNRFAEFNDFINEVTACYKGKYFNLPFNLNTFEAVFNTADIEEIKSIIAKEVEPYKDLVASNLEERALQTIGKTLYETLVKGYSEKQWNMPATKIPAFIIDRIPMRWSRDNNYYNYPFQGIPKDGYTAMFEKMLEGITVQLNVDFLANRSFFEKNNLYR